MKWIFIFKRNHFQYAVWYKKDSLHNHIDRSAITKMPDISVITSKTILADNVPNCAPFPYRPNSWSAVNELKSVEICENILRSNESRSVSYENLITFSQWRKYILNATNKNMNHYRVFRYGNFDPQNASHPYRVFLSAPISKREGNHN